MNTSPMTNDCAARSNQNRMSAYYPLDPLFDEAPCFKLNFARMFAQDCSDAYKKVTLQSDRTDAGVLIVELSKCIIIACRGTRNPRDWMIDAQFLKVPLGGLRRSHVLVHDGFHEDAESLLQKIIAHLDGTTKPIVICGHSLGGGFGSVIAYILAKSSNLRIALVYTFASPRVGNSAWRTEYDSLPCGNWTLGERTMRIAAAGDCIPLVPGIFCPPCDGYRHVGNEIFLTPTDRADRANYKINPSRWVEFFRDQKRCADALKRRDFDFLLQFHSIDGDYIPLLNKCHDHNT